jgi:AcrR family transcriptional regulator
MTVVQNAELVRRPRGRPPVRSDDETRRLVLEAASCEFRSKGYAATSMTDVAQRAGVSTKTMYRLIPTKADLLRGVVSERIGRFLLDFDADALDALPLAEALERMLLAYGKLTLDGETVEMTRLVLTEGDRFPEVAAAFYETAVVRTCEAMSAWLRRQCERGLIALDDVPAAAGMLRGMMIMEPQRAIMLGRRAVPDADAIAARAKQCAGLFLDGCRPLRSGV